MLNLMTVSRALANGETSSTELVEDCLARIQDPAGEGARVFTEVYADAARAEAANVDKRRHAGDHCSPLQGIPVSVKDLADVSGSVTRAGSRVLADAAPAEADAPAVARLREAGLIVIGRTNMTEFAYSGLGLNPHFGTPCNPWDRATGRIPGGSSSGAAVAVTDGMAIASLGTDTGGSCRIPAALCGLVGYKPTASRVPLSGIFPLSTSLDSVGPLAADVESCGVIDAVLAGEGCAAPDARPLSGCRFLLPSEVVLDDLDTVVAGAFESGVVALREAGAEVFETSLALLGEIPELNRHGGLAAPEAWALHRDRLAAQQALYDPRVAARLSLGAECGANEYRRLLLARQDCVARFGEAMAEVNAVLCPTVPAVAPPLADLEDDAEYLRLNRLMLRNPSLFNFLDGCAISLPCHAPGSAPVGMMLAAPGGSDHALLGLARSVEAALNARDL